MAKKEDLDMLKKIFGITLFIVSMLFVSFPAFVVAGAPKAKFFVVPVTGVEVPFLDVMSDRSFVGEGHFAANGMPVLSVVEAYFVTIDLLLPGRERVEDPETKNLRPHLIELRLGGLPVFTHQLPILAIVWDASGKGNAEYLAVAKYSEGEEPRFLGWATYAIKGVKGETLPMAKVGFREIIFLVPVGIEGS